MLKVRALNQESSSDEDVPSIRREAQEEIVLELYNNALKAQARKEYDKSTQILTQLLDENIPQLENNGGLPKSMSTLKYSCYVNLGNIQLNQDNIDTALDSFTNASELDSTDVTLWAKIGKLSLKEDKFNKAAYAFSKGLECNESHWPCLDNLISVLFAIKDTVSCLVYIGKALTLDTEYTKGVVLRKRIYRDNPATKEYYQLFNPEHIWEPQVNEEVDAEEEEEILKEAQLLCDRVIAVEKALGPKPFDTIPLPKTLDDYTWYNLAKTVIYCHQYITDNNMTHFTFFDMSKCMSQTGETLDKFPIKSTEDMLIINKDNKSSDAKSFDTPTETVEKMDTTEPVSIERRSSQNSETTTIGNDNQDNTPIQTDNDEEQNMELDNDETDGDNTDAAQQKRKGKRKRDVLVDLQIWGWHSKRKPPKKPNKDFTVEDALNRIIPKSLLKNKITNDMFNPAGEDSMNTMDIYNMYIENKELNFLSPIHSPKSVNYEAYFGTDRERDDVLSLWTKDRFRVDAIVLIRETVFELSKLWQYKWPKELIPLYIEAYQMFREHCDQPQLFCGDNSFEEIRDDALATLLYGELLSFSSETTESVHPTILSYLQIVSGWSDDWKDEFPTVFIRYYWLQAHCFRKRDENELAIRALEAILEEIDNKEKECADRFSLNLPNCLKYGFVSRAVIEKIIKHLTMLNSLGNIESLFNAQKYAEVAEILKQTFHSGGYSKVGRMGRPAQLGILMHSLWFTNWDECFVWTEECFNEAVLNYSKPNADHDKWEKIIEKCFGIFQEIIKKETVSIIDRVSEENRCRLVENLVKIVCKQLNTEGVSSIPLETISPWLLLHYVLLREEHRLYARKRMCQSKRDKIELPDSWESSEEELPPSLAVLFSAHEFLGPKCWCLTGQGELLHFILDLILDRLDTPIFEHLRDKIDIHIEQALFCLYAYPSKKNKISRHLVDHNVDPLELTWERSFQLYQYYAPDSLPEYNSYKSQSISADLEQLFKRIIKLVPTICALHDHLPKVMEFIHGKASHMPDPVEFPGKIRAIYYLIGDYYFKEKEFVKCVKYFQLDLCINPMRFDSWAFLGLSYSSQLENTLNYCEKLKNDSEFFERAKSAQICFRKSLELDPENLVLWIECGSFEYMVHSFCSRLIKYESENFSMEKFELLETEKESYLDSSGNSLEHAIKLYEIDDSNEPDERWLQYYLLGKIAEKKRKEPMEYLQFYMTANNLLSENNATYPDRINYNNPQHLSVEALELHYRLHASILKYLELHEGKDISNSLGVFFKKCLNTSVKRYFQSPPTPLQVSKTPEAATTAVVSTPSATSFQDQFLNSIKNVKTDDVIEVIEEENVEEITRTCLEDILLKVDEEIKRKEEEAAKAEEEDMDVTIVETEEVIMVISDSEDEAGKNAEVEPQKTQPSEKLEGDVQSLLDKMMEQTMKDTEKMDYSEANTSGTEQVVEEVRAKEDVVDFSKDETSPSQQSDKPESKTNRSSEITKAKTIDSETVADNRKTTADEDSSTSSSSSSSDSSSSDSDSDDSESSSSTSSSSDAANENISHNETLQLVDKCIHGLEICITRLPQNYKALYRLAHVFFNYKGRKDYTKCKQLLLGEYKCKDEVTVTGLFYERNTKNFFNGVWRIPSTEIDRPGSLSAHMNRCMSLVLQVLRNSNDTKTLMEVCMQLKKVPDRDKIYIRDNDRLSYSDQAMDMCLQSFRAQIKNIPNMQTQQITKLMHDIFRAFQRAQKHISSKDQLFSSILVDAYKIFIKEKVPDNVNVLDLAIKFCQQHKPTVEKHKTTVPIQNPSLTFGSRGPGIGNPPVHPAPSALMFPQKPLKPPSVGRPRGRPPLPKVPGQVRQSRGKSPSVGSSTYPWQNPLYGPTTSTANFSYEYLKHYQDELVKQYSQNLSISQLKQLTSFFSSGQLSNPAVAQAVANQFLAQAGLLNPTASNLLRPPASNVGTGAIPMSTSLFMDPKKFNNNNPRLANPALANLTPEQLKFLESMFPNPSRQSKANSSGVKTSSKISGSNRPHQPKSGIFKEPQPSTEDKSANLLMKERPNISITPVNPGLSITPANVLMSKANQAIYSKPSTVTSTVPSFSITKQTAASTATSSKNPKTTSYISSKPKAAYVPTITSSPSYSKPIPAAHTSPQPAHTLPVTPPPVSSPSFVKPNLSNSPGKTLQEKLADKKKEQENKQKMKNMEAEIFAAKLPPPTSNTSANLLKGLNLPNIPASLSVSPSANPMAAYQMPLSMEKQVNYHKYSKPKTSGHSSMVPSSLSVSKSVPPVVAPIPGFTPRFPVESGISISQVTSEKKSSKPIPLDDPMSAPSKDRPKKPISPPGSSKLKQDVPVKKDISKSLASSSVSIAKRFVKHSQDSRKERAKKIEKEKSALSVIKNLSSIELTPLATSSKLKEDNDEVICLD